LIAKTLLWSFHEGVRSSSDFPALAFNLKDNKSWEDSAMTQAIFRTALSRFFVLILTLASSYVIAQVNTADLHGIISDPSGAVVVNAEIVIQTLDTGFVRTTKTTPDGSYTFVGLAPGRYSVRVSASGFRPATVKEITLMVGQEAELSLRLEISPLLKAIEVLADTKLLETRRSSITTTVAQRYIENLPINGRDYINFALLDSAVTRENQPQLAPAPAIGLNIGGQRARANMVSIDGADAIDNTISGVRATVSQEAVQEFQLLKTGYAAEFGRSSSAVINIVTKNGTNQWNGNVFGYLRNRHLSATNVFAGEPDPGDTQTQAGLTLGGPIKRDKTFLFLSFETTQRNSIGFSSIGRDGFGLHEIQNPFGPGSLLLAPDQESYVKSAPPAIAGPYATIASNTARVALYGNTSAGRKPLALSRAACPPPSRASRRKAATSRQRKRRISIRSVSITSSLPGIAHSSAWGSPLQTSLAGRATARTSLRFRTRIRARLTIPLVTWLSSRNCRAS
jgi:hypothetical protein